MYTSKYVQTKYRRIVINASILRIVRKVNITPLKFYQESPAQFENRINPRVYIGRITHSTMYNLFCFVSRNWRKEISYVACGFQPY